MSEHFPETGRWISILDRLMKMYYDRGLADFAIGWGQQFYAEYIYDHPGATAQEMAACIRVDKATLTKCIRKLNEVGYLRIVSDEADHRVKHLYLTEQGVPAVQRIKEIHREFCEALFEGIPPQLQAETEQVLEQMADNLNRKVWHRMEDPYADEHSGRPD